MIEPQVRVLLVDDEDSLRLPLKKFLETNFGYQVDDAASREEALRRVREAAGHYDVVLIDDLLTPCPGEEPRLIGIDLMSEIKGRYPQIEVIVFTGWSGLPEWDRDRILNTLRAGAFRYLKKPLDNDELAMLIRTAAQQVRLREIGRAILSERDLDRVLEGIAGTACSLALAEEAAIALQEQITGKISIHAKIGQGERVWTRHLKSRDLSLEIVRTGQIVYVPDTMQDDRVSPEVVDSGIRSFLGLPIPGGEGNLGVLYVYSRQPGRFDEGSTVAVLQTLASQAGLAIANAQAFQQVQAHARYMEALERAGEGLTRATRLEDQLALVWDFVREQLQVSTFFVALYDHRAGILRFPLYYDEGERVSRADRHVGDDREQWGLAGYVVKTGRELYWPTDEDKQQGCRDLGIEPKLVGKSCQSCFFLPLKIGGEVIGAMSMQSYDRYAFSPTTLDAFRTLGSQLSVALENSRLFEAEARRRQEAETLREAALALTTALEREKVFETILAELQKVVAYDSASVQLLKGDRLEIIGGRGFPNLPELLGISFPIEGDNPNREVIHRRAPFIVADAPAVYKGFTEEPHAQAGIRGWLGVPMLLGDRLIGMIALDKRTPGFYTEEHARLAQGFAAQAAIAIENARLFSELAEAKEWRDALIENAFDAVIAIDQNRRITLFNRRAEEMLGWKSEEMLGRTVARLHPNIETARQILDRVNREGAVSGLEVELKHRDGTSIPALLSATLIRDSQGRPIGQAGFLRDLRRVRLFEDRQRALFRVSQAVAGTLQLDKVLDLVVESAVAAFPTAQGGSIHLYDERTDRLCMRANTFGYSPEAIEASCLRPDEGVAGWVFLHRQPAVVDDVQRDPRYKKIVHPETLAHRSMICVPLQVRGRAIGALSLDNLERPGAFQADDVELLSTFADQAAIAIDNARLYQEVQASRAYVHSLYQASSAIISPGDPREVLQTVVDTIQETTGAWRAVILVVDKGEQPQIVAHAGFDRELEPTTVIRSEGISRQVIRSRQARFFPDVVASGEAVNPRMIEQGTRAAACLPLSLRDKAIGVLWVQFREPRSFSETEQQALQVYANQSAIAYENARRMRELECMRRAAESMAGALGPAQVLQQIAESAAEVLQADSAAIWSYDNAHNQFIPEELAAYGIPKDELEKFRKTEPKVGGTADTVMERGWVGVTDITDPQYGFMGPSTVQLLNSIKARSFQGIALKVGDERLGVLYVNYGRPRSFADEDRRMLETFAHHAGLALKKARLLEQVGKAKKAAEVVARVTVLGKREESLRSVAQGALEAVGCDAVVLFVYDQNTGKLDHPPTMAGVRFPDRASRYGEVKTDSIVYPMLQRDEPYIVERIAEDTLFSDKRFAREENIESCVVVPLKVGAQKVGVMFVNYRSRHRFTADEMADIELLANQAAVAIQNAQQFEQIRRKTASLEALYEAGKALSGTLALDDILSRIVEQAWYLTGRHGKQARFSHLALKEGGWLRFKAAYPPECLAGLCGEVGDINLEGDGPIGVTGRAVKTGKSQLVDDVTQDKDYITYDPETISELAVPIRLGKEVIGVINVEYPERNAFDEEDRRDLEALAVQAALAIQNARHYEELRRTKGLVGARTALAWMGMASSTWRHAIDKHAVTIREQIELARRDLEHTATRLRREKLKERLSMIDRLANQILEKPIVPPLSREEGVEMVVVNDLVSERARQLWQNEPHKKAELLLDLQLPGSAVVRVSPEWLRRAFDILVDNAVEAVADREVRVITIGTRAADGGAEIRVSDTGPGIPDEIRAKIGLEPIEKPEEAKGLGMGLLMTQTIVQTYGGELKVASTGSTGTTMVIWLPLVTQQG